MKPVHLRCIAGSICFVAIALIVLTAGLAHASEPIFASPIITTPTPTPIWSPTPAVSPTFSFTATLPSTRFGMTLTVAPIDADGGSDSPVEVRPEAFTHTVAISDTLWSLALDYGRDLDTMACTTRPTGTDAATLVPGTTITVPALTDLCYTVTPGDTLEGIAAAHGVSVASIVAVPWNALSGPPYNIQPQQRILIPNGRRETQLQPTLHVIPTPQDTWWDSPWPDWPYGDGHFIWPVKGPISQYAHPGHMAIDIAVPVGTPVEAADRGTILMAGWSSIGYGFRVVIDHHIDYITLYAHLSNIYVHEGQVVAKGQVIGLSGATGNVTGPHLHFEIRDFGILTDPLQLLPPPG